MSEYSISGFGHMIADRARMDAYAAALRRSIGPDSVVVDIGTGTGILALLACRFGARRVYAIESDDVIQVARACAADNGYAARIEFIQGVSFDVNLPEQADVIVSDLRGILPPYRRHLTTIADARTRWLKPGGVLIPQRDRLWAVPVSAAELYDDYVSPWADNGFGLNLARPKRMALNAPRKVVARPEQLLADAGCWAVLDYRSVEHPDVSGSLQWTVEDPATGHGLVLWFDADLVPSISFSNGPGGPGLIYGNLFLPWAEPVVFAPGDRIDVALRARQVGDDYLWFWNTRVCTSVGEVKAVFSQSTFSAFPLSPSRLRRLFSQLRRSRDEDDSGGEGPVSVEAGRRE